MTFDLPLPQSAGLWMAQAFIPRLAQVGAAHAPAELHVETRHGGAGALLRWLLDADDVARTP